MTTEIVTVSKKLQRLIDEANTTFGNAKALVLRAYTQAIEDGMTPSQAKELLLEKITAFKKSTIYSFIPNEAKDPAQRNRRLGKHNHNPVPKLEPETPALTIKEKDELEGRDLEQQEPESAVAQWMAQAKAEVQEEKETTLQQEPPVIGTVPDRTTSHHERQGYKLQELSSLLEQANKTIEDLRAKSAEDDEYIKTLKQKLRDSEAKIKEQAERIRWLEQPFDAPFKLPFKDKDLKAKAHVRPANKEISSGEIDEAYARAIFA